MGRNVMTFNNAARNPAYGFLWFIGGAVLLALCIFLPPLPIAVDDSELRALAGILAIGGIVFGAGALLIRQGTRLDRRQGVVETWNGLVISARKNRYPINSFFEVALTRVAVRGEHRTHVFYSVLLISSAPQVLVTQEQDYEKARQIGERVAAFLNLALRDKAGEPVYSKDGTAGGVRAPSALDAPLGERATTGDRAPASFPPPPAGCRIRMDRGPDRVVFALPVQHRSMGLAFATSGVAVPTAAGVAWIFRRHLEPDDFLGIKIFLYAMPGALAILVPTGAIYNALKYRRRQEIIAITPLALSHEMRNSWSVNEAVLPVERIEEFGFTKAAMQREGMDRLPKSRQRDMMGPAVIARTDFKTIEFGRWLRRDEQVWLHDALRYLLIQAQRHGPRGSVAGN